jgi:serine-type D-Ala-D-Ala carboxypeptidase/endopeptidase
MFHRALFLLLAIVGCSAHADIKADLDTILQPQIAHGDVPGVIVGVSDHGVRKYFIYGGPLDEHSIFEIGSFSKVFTGVGLGTLVSRHTVQLDDSIEKNYPTLLGKDASKITLLDLSTHTSGLPRLPTNLEKADAHYQSPMHYDSTNPYR